MKKFLVEVSWTEPQSGRFTVQCENEEDAAQTALDENDEIGEDYEIESVKFLGDVPEIPWEDPNQIKMDFSAKEESSYSHE